MKLINKINLNVRIIIFMSVLFLCAGVLYAENLGSHAQAAECDGWGYTVNDGVAIQVYPISNINKIGTVIVPASLNGYAVNTIKAEAFLHCYELTRIELPATLDMIEESAFIGCEKLKEVYIPEDSIMTGICNYAFGNCGALTTIDIPDSVYYMGFGVFFWCRSLTKLKLPASLEAMYPVFFAQCSGLTSIVIPEGVGMIGESAFIDCTGITSITIPESVYIIEKEAFSGCTNLTSIVIPNAVNDIGEQTFYDCTKLESVTLFEGIASIGNQAFDRCTSLSKLKIKNPNCIINNLGTSPVTILPTTTIYGKLSSTAHTYATTYGNNFVPLDGVVSILSTNPSVSTLVGTELDLTGIVVNGTCGDDSIKVLSGWTTDYNSSNLTLGNRTVTISYKNELGTTLSTTITVSVVSKETQKPVLPNTPTSTVVSQNPTPTGVAQVTTETNQETKISSTKVVLNSKKVTLGRKETYTLKAKLSPTNTTDQVTYTSSKPSIVKVDKKTGKVKALKIGTAVITAKTTSGKKTTCKITVRKAPTRITVKTKTVKLKTKKSYQIKYSLTKSSASYKITYSSSKKSVATVSQKGKIVAKKKGTTKITIKTYNGKKAVLKVTVK